MSLHALVYVAMFVALVVRSSVSKEFCTTDCAFHLMPSFDKLRNMINGVDISTDERDALWERLTLAGVRHLEFKNLVAVQKERKQSRYLSTSWNVKHILNDEKSRSQEILARSKVLSADIARLYHAINVQRQRTEDVKQIVSGVTQRLSHKVNEPYKKLTKAQITEIIKDAKHLLGEKLNASMQDSWDSALNELRMSNESLQNAARLFNHSQVDLSDIIIRLKDIELKLEDILGYSQQVRRQIGRTTEEILANSTLKNKLRMRLKMLQRNMSEMGDIQREASRIYSRGAALFYENTSRHFLAAVHHFTALKKETIKAEEKGGLIQQNFNSFSEKVERARKHVDGLHTSVQQLTEAINKYRQDMDNALEAEALYSVIRDTILDAREDAAVALSHALDKNYKGINQSRMSLLKRNAEIGGRIKDMDFNQIGKRIADAHSGVDTLETNKNTFKRQIQNLTSQLSSQTVKRRKKSKAKKVKRKVKKVDVKLDRLKRVTTIIEEVGKLTYRDIHLSATGVNTSDVKAAATSVDESSKRLRKLSELADKLHEKEIKIRKDTLKLSDELESLKEGIQAARNMANKIRLDMSANGTCIRTYRVMQFSTNNTTISFDVLPKTTADMSILAISRDDAKDGHLITFDMKDNKARLSLNRKNGVDERLTDDRPIPLNTWSHIDIKRFEYEISLTVTVKGISHTIKKAFVSRPEPFHDNGGETLSIGGFSPVIKYAGRKEPRPFTGCISDVVVNGNAVGLYNFMSTTGNCGGCLHLEQPMPYSTQATPTEEPKPTTKETEPIKEDSLLTSTEGPRPTTTQETEPIKEDSLLTSTEEPKPTTTQETEPIIEDSLLTSTEGPKPTTTQETEPITEDSILKEFKPELFLTPPTTTRAPTSCLTDLKYSKEPNGVTFGDTRHSYSSVSVHRKKDLTKDFNVTTGIRTYHKNGLIMWLSNEDQTHFLIVRLIEEHPVLFYDNRKGGEIYIRSTIDATDGEWHSVKVKKKQKTIRFFVDDQFIGENVIRRTLRVTLPMYVGGLPKSHELRNKLAIQSFRGSMANFTLNDNIVDLANSGRIQGISRCYSNIEPGVYLTGASYLIYDENFVVGSHRLFELEFKTTRSSGLIMGISHRKGKPALVLELVNGQVRFSAVGRQSSPIVVMSNLTNPFSTCLNKWRFVRAEFGPNYLNLTVEEEMWRTTDGTSTAIQHLETNGELVIGGFPPWQRSRGTAVTTQNLVGCIRKFKVDGQLVDWYNVSQVIDAHISACPDE